MENRVATTQILQTISIKQFLALRTHKVKPIDGLNIPNITVPPHLVSKKRSTEATDSISINIRQLFNSLTSDNLSGIKEKLREVIISKAQNVEMIEEISQEILHNFLISEQNIKNYMHLLNAVSSACVLIDPTQTDKANCPNKNVSPTIGNFFLNKCRTMIFNCISDANIRNLAQMDQDDMDELDRYNREREKISNLILTICYLYEQRNTSNINLKAAQLYSLISTILNSYKKNQDLMAELGNPNKDDCSDENEYEILRKMCTLFAEQLYTFMQKEAKEFSKDPDLIKGYQLKSLVDQFKTEVVPTLTEAFIISKCESLNL